MERQCEGCKERFRPHPATKGQQRFCSRRACQRERRNRWQRRKRATDPGYRRNQAAAHRAWCARNPGYWSEYRKKNPASADRNRDLQRERNRRRRAGRTPVSAGVPGCSSAESEAPIAAGRYRLTLLAGEGGSPMIAKMDELLVELAVIPRLTPQLAGAPPMIAKMNELGPESLVFR